MSDTTPNPTFNAGGVHPVDERIPTPKLITLGFQHVLVMYAGAIAVPLIVAAPCSFRPRKWRS